MSTQLNNIRISLRRDTLQNWNVLSDQVLHSGEIAIVVDGDKENIKIGNETSSFSQLPYLFQNSFNTNTLNVKDIYATSLAQGVNVTAIPTSIAAGVYLSANGGGTAVFGKQCYSRSVDGASFVFNGKDLPSINDRYYSHGVGTFNINPEGGLNGFYIGENTLSSVLSDYVTDQQVQNKVNYELNTPVPVVQSDISTYVLNRNKIETINIDNNTGLIYIDIANKSTGDITSRDIMLRLNCKQRSTSNPSIHWNFSSNVMTFANETWTSDMDTPDAGKDYLYTFTEIEEGKFLATRKELA